MNTLEIVKDSEGKEVLINNNTELTESETMGQKLDDFEILKLLGKGNSGKVYKAQSKLNKKIYAMKVINLEDVKKNNSEKKLILNEFTLLNKLNFPHVVRYYKNFQEGNNLYIIYEYLSNGDINELIKTREKLKKPFSEEELWEMFLQCIMGLYYIHKNGATHRNIKSSNIFLDENMKIKIGDFGLLDNPIYNTKELNQKYDVFCMGCTFSEMAYFLKSEDYNYSETMKNIINLIKEEDKDKRMTSEQMYEKIGMEYSRITQNSSIDAMITCLNTLKDLNEALKKNIEQYKDKPIIKAYLECIKFLQDKDINFNNWELTVNNFRKQLGLENLKLEGTKEIEPNLLFEYIIKKLFEETKKIIPTSDIDYKYGPHLINTEDGVQQIEEKEAKAKYDKFFEKLDSPIIKNLKGLMKQTNICNICNIKTYSFSSYFYANFNLKKILAKKTINTLDLEETFKMENTFTDNFFCSKCFKKTEHKCTKEFYSFPNVLVIYIQRGITSTDKMEVNIKKNIEVKNLELQTSKQYNLVGLINKINKDNDEHYLSNFYYNNNWFRSERYKNMRPIKPPYESYEMLKMNDNVVDEDTVMLFYTSN